MSWSNGLFSVVNTLSLKIYLFYVTKFTMTQNFLFASLCKATNSSSVGTHSSNVLAFEERIETRPVTSSPPLWRHQLTSHYSSSPSSDEAADPRLFSSSSLKSLEDDELSGLIGICEWYQSRFSSRVSRISWASGWTRSAQVSQRGWTM